MNQKAKMADIANKAIATAAGGCFQLVRYFLLTSLALFIVVALALVYFERGQGQFFQQVQQSQNVDFKRVQDEFAKQPEAAARRDLLAIHEAGNVKLTRLFANALWGRDFAPFAAKTQASSRFLPQHFQNCGSFLRCIQT